MLRTLKDFESCVIGATDGDIGQVEDLYFDDDAWAIRYLIVSTGSWLSGRKVLISPISIRQPDWSVHTLQAAITRGQVKDSPDIDTDKPVYRQHEVQYLGYYGYPTYWGAAGLWGVGMFPIPMDHSQSELPLGAAARGRAIAGAKAERERHRDDDLHLRSCEAVVGYRLHAHDGEIGHVDGFLIDDKTWAIRYFIVNTSNWWFGHKVLIAPHWIDSVQWSHRSVAVALSREEVKAAPHYEASADLERTHEAGLYSHYDPPRTGKPARRLSRTAEAHPVWRPS